MWSIQPRVLATDAKAFLLLPLLFEKGKTFVKKTRIKEAVTEKLSQALITLSAFDMIFLGFSGFEKTQNHALKSDPVVVRVLPSLNPIPLFVF